MVGKKEEKLKVRHIVLFVLFWVIVYLVISSYYSQFDREPTKKEKELFAEAIQTNNVELCSELDDNVRNIISLFPGQEVYYLKIKCIKSIASNTNNPFLCNEIDSQIYDESTLKYARENCREDAFNFSKKSCEELNYWKEDERCIPFLNDEKNSPEVCDVLLDNGKRDSSSEHASKYDKCLRIIFDSKSRATPRIYDDFLCNRMLLVSNKNSCLEIVNEENIRKEETLDLIRKYKNILGDGNKFRYELLNPGEIDFCKLMAITDKYGSIFNPENDRDFWQDNPYKIACYGSFAKNSKAKKECDMENHNRRESIRMVCQGSLYFQNYRGATLEVDSNNPTIPADMRYSLANGGFQFGFGVAAANTEFNISAYMDAPITYEKYSTTELIVISGIFLNKYFEIRNFVENLEPVKFCDIVQRYMDECKSIVES